MNLGIMVDQGKLTPIYKQKSKQPSDIQKMMTEERGVFFFAIFAGK